ncbi:UvrD-helicase domain-containing protein [Burkholderia cepacia]|uniref:UvrD-helicase domain-containing protein n=1 Tax=Burkholderia cepacia TaxID=292 RepID=UPI002FE0741C
MALQRLEADLEVDEKTLVPLWKDVVREQSADRYLTARERANLFDRIATEKKRLDGAFARCRSLHAKRFTISEDLTRAILYLRALNQDGDRSLRQRNDEFVERELERRRGFFAYCEERALTDEQTRAAITFEENTLLIAAAGSGKTSTVVGKVAYALVKGIVRPEEILCLAFNGKAAAEIVVRARARLRAMIADACPLDPAIKNRIKALVDSGIRIWEAPRRRIDCTTSRGTGREMG